jgi:hypothetical protein
MSFDYPNAESWSEYFQLIALWASVWMMISLARKGK